MEPIFTLPYSEYIVADKLKRKLKQVSIFIPSSRQEKGVDIAAVYYGEKKNKITTFQVKYSRPYETAKKVSIKGKEVEMKYRFWFSKFKVPENADWIIIVGVIPKFKRNYRVKNQLWGTIILAFTKDEIKDLLDSIHQKKNKKKKEKFFDFQTDESLKNVFLFRGASKNNPKCLKKYLLLNRIEEIQSDVL